MKIRDGLSYLWSMVCRTEAFRGGARLPPLFLLVFLLLSVLMNGSAHAAAMVSAGSYHTLAVTAQGTVLAWGSNKCGQLGNSTTEDSETPIPVRGLSNVTAVAAGGRHSVALKADGTVWTWGYNSSGQLGDGSTTNSNTPIKAVALTNVVAVAASGSHTLALKNDGTVWEWGVNVSHAYGDDLPAYKATPVQVSGIADVAAIYAGTGLSVAVKKDGTLWAWGMNWWWDNKTNVAPVQLEGFSDIRAVAGDHDGRCLLLLKKDGTVWIVGRLARGMRGNGATYADERLPVQVPGLSGVVAVAAGKDCAAALTRDGSVWTWGDNRLGQGGPKTGSFLAAMPAPVGITDAVAISVGGSWFTEKGYSYAWGETIPWGESIPWGGSSILVLRNDGSIWSWGSNSYGQFGNATVSQGASVTPVEASGLTNVKAVSARGDHTLALKEDGTVWAWGYNEYGQIGDGTTNWTTTPTRTKGPADVTAIAAGKLHSVALAGDGTVWSWGRNENGQLGIGSRNDSIIPLAVPSLADVVAIAAGDSHTLAVKRDGTVWAWGLGESGQLGNGTFSYAVTSPVSVTDLVDIVAVAAAREYSIALKRDGTVWIWGTCYPLRATSVPVRLAGIDDVAAIAAGDLHGVALKKDGTVWSWGSNAIGQFGCGTYGQYTNYWYSGVPVQAVGLTDVTAISAGLNYTMALRPDGSLWVWGLSNNGTVWDSDGLRYGPYPTPVTQLWDVAATAGGDHHAVAIKADGTVWGWGRNNYSQLGNGFDPRVPQKALIYTLFNAKRTSVGAFRGGQWYLDGNGNGKWDDHSGYTYSFGITGDIPLTLEWPGHRSMTAVFRKGAWFISSDGRWDTGNGRAYSFGIPSDVPVAGKWVGGSTVGIGVFRDGAWYLDGNGNGAWDEADITYSFGIAGDIPVTGDWTGSGTTKIGVVRGNTWYLDMNGNGAWDEGVDAVYSFGIPGDVPVTGDWNGSGTTKIGVVRGGSDWFLDMNGNGAWNEEMDHSIYGFGVVGDIPVTGNW